MKAKFLEYVEQNTDFPVSLAVAVIEQLGGDEDYTYQQLEDIANHGIDGGFTGFIYYDDTVEFYAQNQSDIFRYAERMAADIGESGLIGFIMSFRCAEGYTEEDIARTLYGPQEGYTETPIANCLAWFAGEVLARIYVDWIEE